MQHRRSTLLPALLLAACGGAAEPTPTGREILAVGPAPVDQIDLLFVIDASASMQGHQAALAASARDTVFAQLEAELGALPDLHLGVITTDVGVGDSPVCSAGGDGGALQVRPDCTAIDGRFLSDAPDGQGGRVRNYQGELTDAVACLTEVGTDGCGFEQPFEAVRRAVDPGNAANAGFLRDDALLLVVFVSDEDDCSATDLGLYAVDETVYGPLDSYRCFAHGVVCDEDLATPGAKTGCRSREDGEVVLPVAALADELRLRKGDPGLVMIAGVVGPDGPVEVLEGERGLVLSPVCQTDGVIGIAPSIRIRELAAAFPARSHVGDGCQALAGEVAAITRSAGRAMAANACLPEDAPTDLTARCSAAEVTAWRGEREARHALPWCDGDGDTDCAALIDDAACDGAGLRVERRGERRADAHLVVACP